MSTRCPYTALVCRCVLGSIKHRFCAGEAERTDHHAMRLFELNTRRFNALNEEWKAAKA
jgi:hypothetical protein